MADSTFTASPDTGPRTFVDEGTRFKGDFTSSCPIIVNGQIEGDVKAPSVTVTHSGALQGNVEAKTIACRGSVAGVLEADTIELSGTIARNTIVRAQRLKLNIESTSGRIELSFGAAVTIRDSTFPSGS
jgi:cytoskeletal protein CcmA (bactofilin family)